MLGGYIGSTYVNIGADRDLRPPAGLKWVYTVGLSERLREESATKLDREGQHVKAAAVRKGEWL